MGTYKHITLNDFFFFPEYSNEIHQSTYYKLCIYNIIEEHSGIEIGLHIWKLKKKN